MAASIVILSLISPITRISQSSLNAFFTPSLYVKTSLPVPTSFCTTRDCFEVFGKNEDTISFMMNDIKYIQFKCKEGNQLYDFIQDAWSDNDSIAFTIVGKPSINEYNGIRTPQVIIEDVAVISTNSNDEDDDW